MPPRSRSSLGQPGNPGGQQQQHHRRTSSAMVEPTLLDINIHSDREPSATEIKQEQKEQWEKEKEYLEILLEQTQRENVKEAEEIKRWKEYAKRLEKEIQSLAGPNWKETLCLDTSPGSAGARSSVLPSNINSRKMGPPSRIGSLTEANDTEMTSSRKRNDPSLTQLLPKMREEHVFPATRRQSKMLDLSAATLASLTRAGVDEKAPSSLEAPVILAIETPDIALVNEGRPCSPLKSGESTAFESSPFTIPIKQHRTVSASDGLPSADKQRNIRMEGLPASANNPATTDNRPNPISTQVLKKPWDPVAALDSPIGSGSGPGSRFKTQPSSHLLRTPAHSRLLPPSSGSLENFLLSPGGPGDESFMTALGEDEDASTQTIKSPVKGKGKSRLGNMMLVDSPSGGSIPGSSGDEGLIESMLGAEHGDGDETEAENEHESVDTTAKHPRNESLHRAPASTNNNPEFASNSNPRTLAPAPWVAPQFDTADLASIAALISSHLLPELKDTLKQASPISHGNQERLNPPAAQVEAKELFTESIEEMREFMLQMDADAIEREQRIMSLMTEVSRLTGGRLSKQKVSP